MTNSADSGPLAAKLQPPHYNVKLLARGHLVDGLEGVLHNTLTLVRTPAGYGKTTLLSQWYHALCERRVRTLWIGLDEDDQQPEQLVANLAFAASLQGVNSRALLQALQQGARAMSPEEAIKSLIREFERVAEPVVIFLDDYHLIERPKNDQLLSLLLRCTPPNLHLVLASRAKPSFPLSNLRTTGRLREIGPDELRFSGAEIAAFLGDVVSQEDLPLLVDRTEGWPVALQLASIWVTGHADAHELIAGFSGSTEQMAAYMVDQVMMQLPPATREFLIQTSILERINGDLANAVCAREDCWQLLGELERLSALIFPLDAAKTWYRHHHLFADFLRTQLGRRGEAEIRRLQQRASRWFLANDQVFDAVKHACRAGEVEEALSMLDRAGLFYRMLRDGADVYRKLKVLLPPRVLESYPRVAIAQVLLSLKEGELHEACALLEDIKRKVAAGRYAAVQFDRHELEREVLVMDCFLNNYLDAGVSRESIAALESFAGSVDPGDHFYRAVLNNLLCTMHWHHGNLINAMATAHASIEHFTRAGLDYGLFFMNLHLGCMQLLHADVLAGAASLQQTRRIVERFFPYDPNLRALSRLFLAEACYEQNQLDEAGEYLFDALQQVESADGWIEVYISGYRTALGLAFVKQRLRGIEPILESGRKFARRRQLIRLEWFLLMREISYRILAKDTGEARRLMDSCGALLERIRTTFDTVQTWREREDQQCTLARLLIHEGLPTEANAILEPLAKICEDSEHLWRFAQTLILMGLASRALGDMDQASHHLRRALHLTRAERMLRIFLDEGQAAEELLKAVVSHVGIAAMSATTLDWVAQLLTAFAASGAAAEMSLVDRVLTHREQDVLGHLKVGSSNKLIARALDLTENAVKFHLKNIYRKLGVNDRRLAISVAEKRALASPQSRST